MMNRAKEIALLSVVGFFLLVVGVAIFGNLKGFQSGVNEIVVAAWHGVIILFFVGVSLGTLYAIVRIRQMSKVRVIGPSKHGPVQALIVQERKGLLRVEQRVEQLQSPMMDPQQQLEILKQVMQVANASNTSAITEQRLIAMLAKQQQAVPQIEAPQGQVVDSIAGVVRYEEIADEIPPEMSLLGIYPKSGDLEIVTPERYKTTWFVGGSNMGKTNTVYGKVADMVRWGAGIIICDNHAIKKDSLAKKLGDFHHRLILPIAQEPEDIKNAMLAFLSEFRARKSGTRSCDDMWLIVSDEVNATSKLPVKLSDDEKQLLLEVYGIKIDGNVTTLRVFFQLLAETCGYEARGFNMFGFFISQKVAHLSWLRNAMMTVFVHGLLMDSEALLAANNDRKMADLVKSFKKGRTLVYGYEFEPVILQQPLYEGPKEEHPASYPDGEIPTSTVELPGTSPDTDKLVYFTEAQKQREVDNSQVSFRAQESIENLGRVERVAQMMMEGKSVNQIMAAEWGITSPGGAYQSALPELREVQKIIARRAFGSASEAGMN